MFLANSIKKNPVFEGIAFVQKRITNFNNQRFIDLQQAIFFNILLCSRNRRESLAYMINTFECYTLVLYIIKHIVHISRTRTRPNINIKIKRTRLFQEKSELGRLVNDVLNT